MILFKYMALATARRILETSRVGFSRASFFNDPFDTPIATPVPTANPIEGIFADIGAQGKSIVWEENTAFLSLTRTPANQLMWAHYADNHRGAVLAIDTNRAGFLDTETNFIPAHFGAIIYSRERPSGHYHSTFTTPVAVGATHRFVLDHYEKWQRQFLTKPLEWAYEEEVRVAKCVRDLTPGESSNESGLWDLIDLGGRPLHCFAVPEDAIKGIYFGARVERADVEAIVSDFPAIEHRRARLDQRRFTIKLVDCASTDAWW